MPRCIIIFVLATRVGIVPDVECLSTLPKREHEQWELSFQKKFEEGGVVNYLDTHQMLVGADIVE